MQSRRNRTRSCSRGEGQSDSLGFFDHPPSKKARQTPVLAPPGQAALDRANRAALARTALAAPTVLAETEAALAKADQEALARADQWAPAHADQTALSRAATAASTVAAPTAVVVPTMVPTTSAPTPNQAHSAITYRLFLI